MALIICVMSNGDDFSRYPSMKGISLDLPFIKFRYVKVDKNGPEEVNPLRITDRSGYSEDTASLNTRRIVYTGQARVTTLGTDLMVSSASVIHELVYGRAEASSFIQSPPAEAYAPEPIRPSQHSLDIFV
jgi:hypothetical protein